jgi:hypothetical protein
MTRDADDLLRHARRLGWPYRDEAAWRAFARGATPERVEKARAWLRQWERDQDVIDEWNRRDAERRCA